MSLLYLGVFSYNATWNLVWITRQLFGRARKLMLTVQTEMTKFRFGQSKSAQCGTQVFWAGGSNFFT